MLFGLARQSKACLDPDTTVIITVNYDTLATVPCPTANEMEMRISNIRLMSEAPNKVCACAFASISDLFSDLQYIAFVDSGTNTPYQGFASFDANAKSSAAWQGKHSSSGSWKGFVAKVVNSGLKVDDPVELIVRAKTPSNTPVVFNDSLCTDDLQEKIQQSVLGTDEWDPVNEDLKDAHQVVRSMNRSIAFTEKKKAHFTELDDEILTAISIRKDAPVWLFNKNEVSVYPNPSEGLLSLNLRLKDEADLQVEWMDLAGRKQLIQSSREFASGTHEVKLDLLNHGIQGAGFLKVTIGGEVHIRKVLLL